MVEIMRPESAVRIVDVEPSKPTLKERILGFFQAPRSTYLARQEKQRIIDTELEKKAAALKAAKDSMFGFTSGGYTGGGSKRPPVVAPIPMAFGSVTVPGVATWDGEEFTRTMVRERGVDATWYARDRRVPPTPSPGLVLNAYEPEDWNDMTEEEREDAIVEYQKINSLVSMGVTAPQPDPETLAVERMQRRAVANNLARDMEAHKRKLERELKEAEEQEKLYEGNSIYGAF